MKLIEEEEITVRKEDREVRVRRRDGDGLLLSWGGWRVLGDGSSKSQK